MIVLNFELLDQFLQAMANRINNSVFFHFIDRYGPKEEENAAENVCEVLLQFLGRPDPAITALYQCKVKFQKKEERETIIAQLSKAFKVGGEITLVQGRIQEIIMSIA
jgi:hypothetical protein